MTYRFSGVSLAILPLCIALAGPLLAEPPSPDSCGLALTARFSGAHSVVEVRRAVEQVARPHPVRWIAPGQAITLEQNPQRLNVIVDETGRIAAMRCG